MDLVNTATGEHANPQWVMNNSSSYLVKPLSRATTYHIGYSVTRLHTDPALKSGDKDIGNGGVEFIQGWKVTFSPHDGTTSSATIWVDGSGGNDGGNGNGSTD
jgi:hypothetical protein